MAINIWISRRALIYENKSRSFFFLFYSLASKETRNQTGSFLVLGYECKKKTHILVFLFIILCCLYTTRSIHCSAAVCQTAKRIDMISLPGSKEMKRWSNIFFFFGFLSSVFHSSVFCTWKLFSSNFFNFFRVLFLKPSPPLFQAPLLDSLYNFPKKREGRKRKKTFFFYIFSFDSSSSSLKKKNAFLKLRPWLSLSSVFRAAGHDILPLANFWKKKKRRKKNLWNVL